MGEEGRFGEVGAKEFGEDELGGDDVDEAVKGEVDAKDAAGNEEIKWTNGVGDEGGGVVEGKLEGDGA